MGPDDPSSGTRPPRASEVGDTVVGPTPPRGPVSAEDAFAATIAPARPPDLSAGVSRGAELPAGLVSDALPTVDATPPEIRAAGATAAAAAAGALPPLPIVPESHYKADREIARGGMGRIVAAEDQRLGRPVALKELLEPAGEQLTRFQREALITARLQHPGIVPVYEAGRWPTGEPFFAMKLVSGRPLDRVIAEARALDERLALLPRIAAAADAIAYAHSHRVIHRDLKPANVLIGDFGETVVIDWGLAKDLDHEGGPESGRIAPQPATTLRARPAPRSSASRRRTPSSTASSTLTVAGAVMGTPAYMAPEQARGEPVDERADVFALGAMLYHLLAGAPPYNARTATDVIAAAALGRVIPLDERERRAPRELVAIVERAMAQDPDERYLQAGELADELRRFMTGQLVSAHRYTAVQRVGRFVRRHRAAVAIAAVAAVTIALGATLAVRSIVHERDKADRERALAVTRRQAADKLIGEVLEEMRERLSRIGRLDLMAELGGEIRDYYETMSKIQGEMSIEDLAQMATAVEIVGRAERDSGQPDRALSSWTDVRARLAAELGSDTSPATRSPRTILARLDHQIGTIHHLRGRKGPASAAFHQAKAAYAALLEEAPDDPTILTQAAENHDQIGDLLRNDGKLDRAFEAYAEAKSLRRRAAAGTGSRPSEELMALSTSHLKLGSIHQARGESANALAEYGSALSLRERLLESQPDNIALQEKVLAVQEAIAELQRVIGDLASAAETYQRAMPVIDRLVRHDPSNAEWKRQRGNLLADLGFALLDSGELAAGDAQLTLAIENQRELLQRDPRNTSWTMALSQSLTRAGDGKLYLGRIDEGMAYYREALELRSRLAKREPTHVPFPRAVAWAYTKLGNGHAYKQELERAIEAHERALAIRLRLAADAPAQVGFRNELASSEITLGRLLAPRAGKRPGELIGSGLERARSLVAADGISDEWKRTLVQGLLAQAELARVTAQPATRKAALAEALAISEAAAERAPQNVHWTGFVAEAHAGHAELAAAAGDARGAAAGWKAVRDRLGPLAAAGRLPAPRKPLLERAKLGR